MLKLNQFLLLPRLLVLKHQHLMHLLLQLLQLLPQKVAVAATVIATGIAKAALVSKSRTRKPGQAENSKAPRPPVIRNILYVVIQI